MISKIFYVLIFSLAFVACSNNTRPTPPTPQHPHVSVAEASRIATQYAQSKGLSWGTAQFESSQGDEYFFIFPTPENEMGVLGIRTIFVNKHTGDARIPLRY